MSHLHNGAELRDGLNVGYIDIYANLDDSLSDYEYYYGEWFRRGLRAPRDSDDEEINQVD